MYPIEKYQFKTYETTNDDGSKTTVVLALSTYAGKTVKGYAKCMETDEFSMETGKKLAAARCNANVCRKRHSRAARQLREAELMLRWAQEHYNKCLDYSNESFVCSDEADSILNELEQELM